MNLTITGYSTALFSTWYSIDELGLLFDAGDGVTSSLLQKSRKINHVFISHADRDHLTGLYQLNQLNARPGFPIVYYPKDCGSFPAMETFSKKFDPHVSETIWKPITHGDRIEIKDNTYVEAIKNGHVTTDENATKSLSYKVIQVKRKLKPELRHLSGDQIKNLTEQTGKDSITIEVSNTILGYSGDTPVEDLERWNNCHILIHESTFLNDKDSSTIQTHGNRHSKLEEVFEMVSQLQIEKLILGHFSSRYSQEQIDRNILELSNKYAVSFKVYRLLPGQVISDILKQDPVNK
jgi:ribonuclease Z